MNRNIGISTALAACLLLGMTTAVPAAATLIYLESNIDGAQANAGAGTGSLGTGSATMIFDDTTQDFWWEIEWSDLTTPVFAAHFHGPALPNQNAGVEVSISVLTSPSIGHAVLTGQQTADLLAELWYINLHTANHPSGEIRGQVVRSPKNNVPEPGVVALMLIGLASLVYVQQRRLRIVIAG